MVYSPIMNAFRLSGEETGGQPNYMKALQQGFQGAADVYKPRQASENLLAQMLANKMNKPKAEDAQGWYDLEKQGLQGQNSMRGMQMDALRRKMQADKDDPLHGATGETANKIRALLYMQNNPDLFRNDSNAQNITEQLPVSYDDINRQKTMRQDDSFIPSFSSGAQRESQQKVPNPIDALRQSITQSFEPKDSAYQGPAREARDLERLRKEVGENSPVYKQAVELANQKKATNESLTAQRNRRAEGLKPGEDWVRNAKGENIGISRDFTKDEKKEEKGRKFFNPIYQEILKSTSYYSGQGSIERFAEDALKYKTDKRAQQRIDNYLAALKLLPAGIVKENATLGGANTNQVYNRLISSLNSSDLPKKVNDIVKKYGLPKEAEYRAGTKFQDSLNKATEDSKKIPARHTEYLSGDKEGHIYDPKTKSLRKMIVSPEHWDEFTKAGGY